VVPVGVILIPYHLAFAKKVIPQVWVGRINLGNKDINTAQSLVTAFLDKLESDKIIFSTTGEDKSQEIALIDLGITFDVKQTVKNAYLIGRSGNLIKDTKDKITAYRRGIKISPVYTIDNAIYTSRIEKYFGEEEEEFTEASLTLENGQVIFKPGQAGKIVDEERVRSCIENIISHSKKQALCEIGFLEKKPQYTQKDFLAVRSEVLALKDTEVSINWPGGADTLKENALLDLLEVEPQGLFVSLEKATQYAEDLSQRIDRNPVNASFEIKEDGKLALFTPASEGVRLEQDSLVENLVELLDQILKTDPSQRKKYYKLEAKTELLQPEISSAENEYGIETLLGEGKSNYHGSISGRIYNIKLASKKLNGRLIKPGAVVSFNNLLGDVSADTGYKSSYVIINNQTILGAGGGVCQTSTTMFRAALNAGLPILDRTAHLYRVHYYEPPLGIDATVMAPYTDFVFKNNTPAYLLIQTHVNGETEDVIYRIFGTDDGRKTVVSEPVITNQTGYPEPIYKDDPTLEKEKTVQVEWAAAGATATVTRKVTRNGEILEDDTFVSNYVPWPAVYLVGTKE